MIIGHIGGGSAPAYQIGNSLRFDGSNDLLSRVFGAPTNNNKFTFSCWVKRSKLGSRQGILGRFVDNGSSFRLSFESSDIIFMTDVQASSTKCNLFTAGVFRDTTSHYHIVMVVDIANATAADRNILYVNGVRQALSLETNYGSGDACLANQNTAEHYLGLNTDPGPTSRPLGGYLSEIHWVDGQALAPSSFGETDPLTGQWVPKKYAGIYGSNGFYLPFSNSASTATLGQDSSGNSNNWTLNNMVRDGSVTDCFSYDTPTSNYCTINDLSPDGAVRHALINGNLTATLTSSSDPRLLHMTTYPSAGKWYFEYVQTAVTSVGVVGISDSTALTSGGGVASAKSVMLFGNGNLTEDGVFTTNIGSTFAVNDVIGVAFDLDTLEVSFYKNGTLMGTVTGVSPGEYSAAAYGNNLGDTFHLNFGQVPRSGGSYSESARGFFRHAPPSGFKALQSSNLGSEVVVTSGSFTGNGSADGPFVWMNGTPETLTIDGNAVTFGTHADKLANGFKLRTASGPYNDVATNNWTATILSPSGKSAFRNQRAKVNP